MGFIFARDRRAGAIRVMSRSLKVDEATAAKIYDGSRPTMTADGAVSDEAQKKMTAFILKLAGMKEAPPADKLYDFSLVKKAHLALQAKGWQPGS
jgi:hypothetical protein